MIFLFLASTYVVILTLHIHTLYCQVEPMVLFLRQSDFVCKLNTQHNTQKTINISEILIKPPLQTTIKIRERK